MSPAKSPAKSPANEPADDAVRRAPRAATGARPGRRLIYVCAVLLSAALALDAAQPAHAKPHRQTPESARGLELVPDTDTVSLCPGRPSVVRLTVKGFFDEGAPRARTPLNAEWGANGGSIKGDWRGAEWDLSGLKEGTYTATFTLRRFSNTLTARVLVLVGSASRSVKVEPCPVPKPICRNPSLNCPAELKAGDRVAIKVSWLTQNATSDGAQAVEIKPTFEWVARGHGKIVGGQNTPQAVLQADEVSPEETGREIRVQATLQGYSNTCQAACTILIQKPTPMPTATATPEASPTPLVTLAATPEPPTPSPTDTSHGPEGGGTRLPLLLLAVAATLGAGALIAAKLFASQLSQFFNLSSNTSAAPPSDPGSLSAEGSLKREGAAAVVYGGLKQKADVVHCTVYAPPRVAPGDQFIVQVFAHLAKQAKQLAEQAARADATARDHGSKPLQGEVERGTLLTFTLEAPGLKVDEIHRPGETLVWRGEPESVQFAVDVPEDYAAAKPVRCTVRIYSGEARAPVGLIMFMLDVAATPAPAASANVPAPPPQTVKRYTHAFVSYCSKDRDKVLPIYLGKRTEWRKAGITDFFDRKDIAAGAGWREEVQKNLDRCDLFVLFWSTSAKCSEEVGKEIAYALARKGSDEWNPPTFDPLSIELPVPLPLPTGLESLNFDDPLLYFIKAGEASREEGDATRPRPGGTA